MRGHANRFPDRKGRVVIAKIHAAPVQFVTCPCVVFQQSGRTRDITRSLGQGFAAVDAFEQSQLMALRAHQAGSFVQNGAAFGRGSAAPDLEADAGAGDRMIDVLVVATGKFGKCRGSTGVMAQHCFAIGGGH